MDPRLMPSLGPVARAIDGIRIVCSVNMTVLDRMDFFLLKTGIETMIICINVISVIR